MTLCEACGRRPAHIEFTQVSGEMRRVMHLCRECALSLGVRSQIEAFQRLSKLLMESPLAGAPEETRAALASCCAKCGYIFEQFVNSGLLGCPDCYREFHELLVPVLRRLHGVTRKAADEPEAPERPPELSADAELVAKERERLETELRRALFEEDYEKAAALRDKLKRIP